MVAVTDTLEGDSRQLTSFSPEAAGVRRFLAKSDDYHMQLTCWKLREIEIVMTISVADATLRMDI